MKKYIIPSLLLTLAFNSNSYACMDHQEEGEVAAAYQGAMEAMHHDMSIKYTNNADIDFVRGMIPHHQGAVEMAKIQLKYGKDRELRKLSEEIIAAQKKEIEFMKKWQAKNDKLDDKGKK